jgi:glyoxylase-like metal-dependent hydrolase (beta-lactamase superfamily II)
LGISDYRECHEYCFGYTKLNRIISQYEPFDLHQAVILDTDTPVQHEDYWPVGTLEIGDLRFEILEGSGGHLYGECIFLERRHKVVFTGDILVNIKGFSKGSAEFNAFAPYLMRSVNVDRARATHMRERLLEMIDKEYLICGGHGPLFQKEGDA